MSSDIHIGEIVNYGLFQSQLESRKILANQHMSLDIRVLQLSPTVPPIQQSVSMRSHINGMIIDDQDRVVRRGVSAAIPHHTIATREAEGSCNFYEIFQDPSGILVSAYVDPVLGVRLCEYNGFHTPLSQYATLLLNTRHAKWANSTQASSSSFTWVFKICGPDLAKAINGELDQCLESDEIELVLYAKITNANGWTTFSVPGSVVNDLWDGQRLVSLGKFSATSSPNTNDFFGTLPKIHSYEAIENFEDGTNKIIVFNVKKEYIKDVSGNGIDYVKVVGSYQCELSRKLDVLRSDRVSNITVWDALRFGASRQQVLEAAGSEYSVWTNGVIDLLQNEHRVIRQAIMMNFHQLIGELKTLNYEVDYDPDTRKYEMSSEARKKLVDLVGSKDPKYRYVYFSIVDGKNIIPDVWSKIRPTYMTGQKNSSKILEEFLKDVDKVEV